MQVQGVHLSSLGAYVPEPASAALACERGEYDREAFQDSGFLGAAVAGEMSAPDMAVLAARSALRRGAVDPSTVDFHVHASSHFQGPEMWSPTGYILRELGVGPVPSLEIRNGCNGMLSAVEIAVGQLTGAAGHTTALLTAADNYGSPMLDRWSSCGSAMVLGDAGAAVVLSSREGFAELRSVNSATVRELEGMHREQRPLLEQTATSVPTIDLSRRFGDFSENVMPGREAIPLIIAALGDVARRSLSQAGITASDVARVVYVNAAGNMVDSWVMQPLGLPMALSTWEYGRTVGHLGACDQVASLDHLLREGELAKGDHVLLLGGAPGFSVAAAVLTMTRPID